MKRFLSALALLLTFGFMLSANAAELTVTGAEAKDLYLFGDEMMKATLSMSPCINKYKSQTSDTYKLFYTCVCKSNDTVAKASIKKADEIFKKYPKWASYSKVKVVDGNNSAAIYVDEHKKLMNSINSCLR